MFFEKNENYLIVLGGFLIQLTLGGFYTSGNIQPNIVKYMQNYSYSQSSVTNENSVWIFGVLLLGMGAAISLGGFIEMQIGPTKTVLIGGWVMSFNICLMFVTMKSYLSIVIISYGLIGGFGMGVAYGVSLGTPLKYFPQCKGLIFGIVVSGISFSSIIFDAVQDSLIYENKKIIMSRLPMSFLILGSIYSIIQLAGSTLMKKRTVDKNEERSGMTCSPEASDGDQNEGYSRLKILNNNPQLQTHQLPFVLDFWILWMIMFLNSFCVSLITSLFNRYSAILLTETKFNQKIIFTVAKIFNCFGRIFWGFAIDKKPFKILMLIITLTISFLIGILPVISQLNVSWHVPTFAVWFVVIHFFLSGTFSIFPIICCNLFGMKYFVSNYGLLFTSCSVGGTIISLVIMLVFPESSRNFTVFTNMIIIGCVLSFVAALLTLLYRGKPTIVIL